MTHHSRGGFSGQMIGPSHRHLPDNTTLTIDRESCLQRFQTRDPSKRGVADPSLTAEPLGKASVYVHKKLDEVNTLYSSR